MLRLSIPLVFGLALCGGGVAGAGDHDPADDNGIGNDDVVEDPDDADNGIGNDEADGPCGDATWGRIGEPGDDWVHVSALVGDDATGDGTVEHPFLTVAAAVDAARVLAAGTDRVVAVWPGAYDATVSLLPAEGWDGDDVALLGCSATESLLVAADPDAPVIDAAVGNVAVEGLGLVGGTAALTARDGSTVRASHISVSGSREAGIAAFDAGTILKVESSEVVAPPVDGCGWGIASWSADTSVTQSTVTGARGTAIFADGGALAVHETSLDATLPDLAGRYGRAIHAQYAQVSLHNSYLTSATDASIFLLQPLGGDIRGVIIDITGAGIVGQETTGDAIVIVGPSATKLRVKHNWITAPARAGLLLEDANVDVSANTLDGAGIEPLLGAAGLGQKRMRVGGADAASILWLAPADELALDRDPMVCSF